MSLGLLYMLVVISCFFFFKQKTAYEMRISDWSSDVCSSDLCLLMVCKLRWMKKAPNEMMTVRCLDAIQLLCEWQLFRRAGQIPQAREEIGRASCRERVCQYV